MAQECGAAADPTGMDDPAGMGDPSVGLMLRRARQMADLDDAAAARCVGITRRRLRRIETGRAGAPAELIDRAVNAYGRDRFVLPDRHDLWQPDEPGVIWIGAERLPFDPVLDGNRTLLIRYLGAVRRQRGLDDDDPVEFRAADLVALATVLDLNADGLERELSSLAGLDRGAARRTVRMLLLTALCVLTVGGATLSTRSWFSAASPFGVRPHPVTATPAGDRIPIRELEAGAPGPSSSTALARAGTDALERSPFTMTASLAVRGPSPFGVTPHRGPDGRDRTFHLFTVSA